MRGQAWAMWEASGRTLKLCEIAENLKVPAPTVRTWKHRDIWDKKNERSTPKKERSAPNDTPKRKRGAQPGNKNAVGAGAPLGNINAVKHGVYSMNPLGIRTYIETDEDGAMTIRYVADKDRGKIVSPRIR